MTHPAIPITIAAAAGLGILAIRSRSRSSAMYPMALAATQHAVGTLDAEQRKSLKSLCYWNEKLNPGDDGSQLVYIIATCWHESSLRPVRENFEPTDAQARQRVIQQGRSYAVVINGQMYYGRGLIQLTLLDNYRKAGLALGYDFVNNPDLVMDPDIAAHIAVWGMVNGAFRRRNNGRPYKLSDYITNGGFNDYFNAREIVNSKLDNAAAINETAVKIANYNYTIS